MSGPDLSTANEFMALGGEIQVVFNADVFTAEHG